MIVMDLLVWRKNGQGKLFILATGRPTNGVTRPGKKQKYIQIWFKNFSCIFKPLLWRYVSRFCVIIMFFLLLVFITSSSLLVGTKKER
jgi:hypothetical protein